MLFPMEPKEFWRKLKEIVEEVVMEQNHYQEKLSVVNHANRPLLKASEVCSIFQISKPTLYDWMHQGKLQSVLIGSRRFFEWSDIEQLINSSKVTQGLS